MNYNNPLNTILDTDSYKTSHYKQYPEGSEITESYVEARGGMSPKVLFFGLQLLIKEYLTKPVTMEQVEEAKEFFEAHGTPFYYEGWKYIVEEHGGMLPIEIEAVPEGMRVPNRNVLAIIRNTDPKCFWLTNYLETMLLRIWYPITVATQSNQIKQLIWGYELETCDNPIMDIMFKVHDFGSRGTSCREQAMIGGMAHLVNFSGTDTVVGAWGMNKYYNNGKMSGFSIPATEHSTMTSWGRENELEAYRNMLLKYKDSPVIACVMDSYDIYNACEHMLGEELKDLIVERDGVFVARPDSGDPIQVVFDLIKIFDDKFGHTVNNKGYKVLNNVRIIQGDGINIATVKEILAGLKLKGWSCENVNFGIGGALLQRGIDRDTFKFATKCSAIRINGEWQDVYKDPINSFKKSKKGRLALQYEVTDNGEYRVKTVRREECTNNLLQTVFKNGEILKEFTLDEVKANTDIVINEL